jgi:predicted HTH transcriptional regulator
VLKTVAGLLNAKKGGALLLGVADSGDVLGLADDYASLLKKDRDGFELHLRQLFSRDLGDSVSVFLTVTFHELDGNDICQVTIEPSDHPVYVTEGQASAFYLRVGNATRPLPVNEAIRYVQTRWGGVA